MRSIITPKLNEYLQGYLGFDYFDQTMEKTQSQSKYKSVGLFDSKRSAPTPKEKDLSSEPIVPLEDTRESSKKI